MGGTRWEFCPECRPPGNQGYAGYSSMRALYIRLKEKGFTRVGWLYEKCGHIRLDQLPGGGRNEPSD